MMDDAEKTYRFPRSHRLLSREHFDRVFAAKAAKPAGPLRVHAAPNDLGHPRLGVVLSRRVGTAVRRNAIRRKLREAFRLLQYELGGGYDFVVVVGPHEPLALDKYQSLLARAARQLDALWTKRTCAKPAKNSTQRHRPTPPETPPTDADRSGG